MRALLMEEPVPGVWQEAVEATRMVRAGIVRPWGWEEFGSLDYVFARMLLEAWEAVVEVEQAKTATRVEEVGSG